MRKQVTLTIPVHPKLLRVIEATPMIGVRTFLVTKFGKPFTGAGFGNGCESAATRPDCPIARPTAAARRLRGVWPRPAGDYRALDTQGDRAVHNGGAAEAGRS
jgi:hypothetical protein